MNEIDASRYAHVTRGKALQMLERAELKPDKFTAHRDRTFTAKYRRDRLPMFSQRYEERMESASTSGVAIFKRPSSQIDRGPYVTLQFAVPERERLGLPPIKVPRKRKSPAKAASVPPAETFIKPSDTSGVPLLTRLSNAARDMKQLIDYAHELIEKKDKPEHLLVTLDELKKHADLLTSGLQQLSPVPKGAGD